MEFICPYDGTKLIDNTHSLSCTSCDSKYVKEDNLIHFLNSSDDFYEGAYHNSVNFMPGTNKLVNALALWTINSGYLNHVKNNFKEKDILLEVGCAGGVSFFGQRYKMIGCDLSLSSLKLTRNIYETCIHANPLERLPLPDNSVEGVISSYFWEHLSETGKEKCIKEFYRVLKPNGKLVFLYDVETENPLINFFKKRDFNLYKKNFLDVDGHIGYQTVEANKKILQRNNFTIIRNIGLQKTFFQEPSVYEKLLKWNKFKWILKLLSKINKSYFLKPYLFFLRILDIFFSFLPDSWSRICLTIATVKK